MSCRLSCRGALAASAAFALGGCATARRTTVFVDNRSAVRLESKIAHGEPISLGCEHPAQLTPSDLEYLLSTIRIRRSPRLASLGGEPSVAGPQAAFTFQETEFISEHASEALARANPNEFVTFVFDRPSPRLARSITAGALFVRHGRLNVSLANDQSPFDRDKDVVPDEELAWRSLDTGAFELAAGPDQQRVEPEPGTERPDGPWPKAWLALDYRKILVSKPQAPSASASAPAGSSIEERMKTLQRLYEEKLISDDEYRAKRKQLLDSL